MDVTLKMATYARSLLKYSRPIRNNSPNTSERFRYKVVGRPSLLRPLSHRGWWTSGYGRRTAFDRRLTGAAWGKGPAACRRVLLTVTDTAITALTSLTTQLTVSPPHPPSDRPHFLAVFYSHATLLLKTSLALTKPIHCFPWVRGPESFYIVCPILETSTSIRSRRFSALLINNLNLFLSIPHPTIPGMAWTRVNNFML